MPPPNSTLPISVVINTYNRAPSLALTLAGLSQLDYPNFEVVVVNGPSTDDTQAVMDGYAGRIKVAHCEERNLSMSRNIGIAHARGDVVAFIDDDAYPDPAWLDRLAEAYGDEEVAGAGGPAYDQTGYNFQVRYLISDRIGRSERIFDTNPDRWLSLPGGSSFASLIGTNSSFHRRRLIRIGGFDEKFDYFLDETDVCARLIDAGYVIRQLESGYVYHKFLPSAIRGESRATRDRFTILKNACYFALKNAHAGSSFYRACVGLAEFVEIQRRDYEWNIERGLLTQADRDRFEADLPAAFNAGLEYFLESPARIRSAAWFDRVDEPWLPFPILRQRRDRLHVCFFSQDYPPGPVGGIGRITHDLATELAAEGHVVRVLTKGGSHNRVDLEGGVWVHRIVAVDHRRPDSIAVPDFIWDHAASLLDELRRIDATRPIDVVQVPNWDAEGLAVVLDGTFRCAVGLYTPMKTLQRIDPTLAAEAVKNEIAECERFCYLHADALLADSEAVIVEIEAAYGIVLERERVELIPLGLADRHGSRAGAGAPGSGVTILFVGRLERRKGVDTLLASLPVVLERFPDASVVLAGRDDLPADGGPSYRAAFETSSDGQRFGHRVRFTGAVSDDELARLYAECDIFVAPSRFESFGLILVEAMMFSKPVVACDVGGVVEVVRHGETGLLVAPGDVEALAQALCELCDSPELRARLGARSRQVYEEQFTITRMAERVTAFYQRLSDRQSVPLVGPASG